ncbi:hypothetical protein [Ideonella livida]|uniref:Transferrin-binding protein B C-lobe/N-lobe beta barrel domain-containing protein n=1 Tax=Ideonella livida TaxID=2707176 RepID=A0A7C9PFR6_9BURK|nr:hypothetical protein [Ideonella livida]NDY90796.1 hypothetical protein [Ideonella livida]
MRLSAPQFLSLLSLGLLSACGGGGSDSSEPDTVTLAAGDTFTYQRVVTPEGGSGTTSHFTEALASINLVNGKSTRIHTFSNGAAGRTLQYASTDVLSGATYGSTNCVRTANAGASTRTFAAPPLATEQTWTYGYVDTCTTGAAVTALSVTGSGRIIALETVSGTAGSFQAVRYALNEMEFNSAASTYTQRSATCLRDTVMGIVLSCTTREAVTTEVGGPAVVTTLQTDLIGFKVADHPASVSTVARFAGVWSLDYTGSDTGECASLRVDADGLVSATCASDLSGDFTLAGTVSSNGAFSATTSHGRNFSGTFSSPSTATGNWLGTVGAVGAWSATHR